MKRILSLALAFVLVCNSSCSKKGSEGGGDCENDNTCTVTVSNTGTQPLKVEIAEQLTPQYQAIDPVLSQTLAPGQTATMTIPADRYFVVWSSNCATSCNVVTSYARTYESCSNNDEQQGI